MAGGWPVSMKNIKSVTEICRNYNLTVFMDACRFAENSYLIKTNEDEYRDKTPKEIAREMFSYFDGCMMSAKKDGLCNIGGFIATKSENLFSDFESDVNLYEGFITYGGLAGRDLNAIAVGLNEVLDESYLHHRIESIRTFGMMLKANGVPIVEPTGGYAVFIDAAKVCPHIEFSQFPAWALNCALYVQGGIRGFEVGNVMYGIHSDGTPREYTKELVRFSIPRRTYTQIHFEYVAKVAGRVVAQSNEIQGMQIIKPHKRPLLRRHLSARLLPIMSAVKGFYRVL